MKGNPGVFAVFAAAVVLLFGLVGGAAGKAGLEVMELIEDLEVGEAVSYGNLTVIPVYSDRMGAKTTYTTLDEALAKGYLEITEVGGGSVPQVSMSNRSGECVFVMGGEILTGGRQDRIVGRDVLLAPRSKNIIVPVYCVEQGRWTYETQSFQSKRNLGTARLRAEGQKAGGDAQSRIWSHVSDIADRTGAGSPTSRFQEAYGQTEYFGLSRRDGAYTPALPRCDRSGDRRRRQDHQCGCLRQSASIPAALGQDPALCGAGGGLRSCARYAVPGRSHKVLENGTWPALGAQTGRGPWFRSIGNRS
jgi:hypothetical protein